MLQPVPIMSRFLGGVQGACPRSAQSRCCLCPEPSDQPGRGQFPRHQRPGLGKRTQSRNQVIYRFFQGHNDAHLTVTCEV